MRLWWPMEDYKNLNWSRIVGALTNLSFAPDLRYMVECGLPHVCTATNNNSLTLENCRVKPDAPVYSQRCRFRDVDLWRSSGS